MKIFAQGLAGAGLEAIFRKRVTLCSMSNTQTEPGDPQQLTVLPGGYTGGSLIPYWNPIICAVTGDVSTHGMAIQSPGLLIWPVGHTQQRS
jgi:hypothetical protein